MMLYRTMLAVVVIVSACGCTIVKITDAKEVHWTYLPGLALVSIEPKANAGTALSVASYGFGVSGSSAVLGVHKEQAVSLPSGGNCQAIFFINSDADFKAALHALEAADPDRRGICYFAP